MPSVESILQCTRARSLTSCFLRLVCPAPALADNYLVLMHGAEYPTAQGHVVAPLFQPIGGEEFGTPDA